MRHFSGLRLRAPKEGTKRDFTSNLPGPCQVLRAVQEEEVDAAEKAQQCVEPQCPPAPFPKAGNLLWASPAEFVLYCDV